MIRIITANDPRFKSLTFQPGLNVVLAEKTQESSDQQTRNSSGKSSLLRVMHFLLGSNLDKPFKAPEFEAWVFAMGFDVGGLDTVVARSPGDARKTHRYDLVNGHQVTNSKKWKEYLGAQWFGIGGEAETYKPSFRSLISYFVREAHDGGMDDPFSNSKDQRQGDAQIAISYMLGLDWRLASQLEEVRDEARIVDNLGKAAKSGDLGSAIGSAAELRTKVAVARDDVLTTRSQMDEFKVLDGYAELQTEADELTRAIRELSGADATDRDLILDLETAMREEAPPGAADLERLWRSVDVLLPDAVVRTYDEARAFHESVISNRINYLSREAEAARLRIAERDQQRVRLSNRRREILSTLESGGALEQFAGMQAELGRLQGLLTSLEERLKVAESIESGKARVERKRQDLLLRLQEDLHDRSAVLDKAIAMFERFSKRLYDDRRGSLIVEPSTGGLKFRVEILGSGSVGIDSMQILCFDLTLMTLLAEQGRGPGFLVHDSHIFDGVDERQVANALVLASEIAEEHKFQYIVTMNEDDVPSVFPAGFDFPSYINDVRLTDATDDGGLFGMRLKN